MPCLDFVKFCCCCVRYWLLTFTQTGANCPKEWLNRMADAMEQNDYIQEVSELGVCVANGAACAKDLNHSQLTPFLSCIAVQYHLMQEIGGRKRLRHLHAVVLASTSANAAEFHKWACGVLECEDLATKMQIKKMEQQADKNVWKSKFLFTVHNYVHLFDLQKLFSTTKC